jgi:hypothetical protein
MKYLHALPFHVILLIFACSCKNSVQPLPLEPETIVYQRSGGYGGGIATKLKIQSDGLAILQSNYPPLHHQLSPAEHAWVFSLFQGYDTWKDEMDIICADDFLFTFQLTQGGKTTEVHSTGCSLERNQTDPNAARILASIGSLESLANSIYQQEAPWIGLKAEFGLDKSVYRVSDTITMTFRLVNTTSIVRTLWFPTQSQTSFTIHNQANPALSYYLPCNYWPSDTANPSTIVVEPYRQSQIEYRWIPVLTNSSTGETLKAPAGYYAITMRFLAGDLGASTVFFEITP